MGFVKDPQDLPRIVVLRSARFIRQPSRLYAVAGYDPSQPRDEAGRWSGTGGSAPDRGDGSGSAGTSGTSSGGTATTRDELVESQLKTLDDWTQGRLQLKVRDFQTGKDGSGSEDYEKLKAVLDSTPKFDGRVYRGVGFNSNNEAGKAIIGAFQPGAEVELSITQSWSKNELTAAAFSTRGYDNQYIFSMEGVEGHDISGLVKDGYRPQEEVVVDSYRDRPVVRVKSVETRDVVLSGVSAGFKATYIELEAAR